MTDLVRRLVSGNKARFKDDNLNLELDLAYITDQVIVMGYPAIGMEGLYRNRREDAKKFLDHRHGKNYWIFNFCPIRENSYDASVFDGRVSRYPFPDHHAPPLATLALVAREMRLWLEGSPERVAVLHCKAGKGRSGTLACSYLLTLDSEPVGPRLERSYSKKEWKRISRASSPSNSPSVDDSATPPPTATAIAVTSAEKPVDDETRKAEAVAKAERIMGEMPTDDNQVEPETAPDTDVESIASTPGGKNEIEGSSALGEVDKKLAKMEEKDQHDSMDTVKGEGIKVEDHALEDSPTPILQARQQTESPVSADHAAPGLLFDRSNAAKKQSTLASVLELHTSRRMRRKSEPSSSSSSSSSSEGEGEREQPKKKPKQGVSIPSQRRWLLFWSMLLADEGPEYFWPPLPHPPTSPYYDTEPFRPRVRLVEIKVQMKESRGMKVGVVKAASSLIDRIAGPKKAKGSIAGQGGTNMSDLWFSLARYDDEFVDVLEKWERWSREAGVGGMGKRRAGGNHMPKIKKGEVTDTPAKLQEGIKSLFDDGKWDEKKMVRSFAKLGPVDNEEKHDEKTKTITQVLRSTDGDGVIIDANREVRFKLYMGKVFMTWLWIIPAFLLPPLSHDTSNPDPVTLTFDKSDCDFPIGLGSDIIDIKVTFQQIAPDVPSEPPPSQMSGDSRMVGQEKGAGLVGNVIGAIEESTGLDVREGVEINQGLDE